MVKTLNTSIIRVAIRKEVATAYRHLLRRSSDCGIGTGVDEQLQELDVMESSVVDWVVLVITLIDFLRSEGKGLK